jgi:hypothetical protein
MDKLKIIKELRELVMHASAGADHLKLTVNSI